MARTSLVEFDEMPTMITAGALLMAYEVATDLAAAFVAANHATTGEQRIYRPAALVRLRVLLDGETVREPGADRIARGVVPRQQTAFAPMPEQTEYGTSHISVVDAQGRAVAMTTTIEAAFGSRRMVSTSPSRTGGFLLNNELTDFSFLPETASGQKVANRVEAGKRPRSSMSPTLVFDDVSGRLLLTTGSPGGGLIIHYTARMLIGRLNWQLNAQEAINLPHLGTLGGPVLMEAGRHRADRLQALRALGHTVQEVEMVSGLQAIERRPDGWFGGADPRREGIVLGD